MGSIVDKINYTLNAVNDITEALSEIGVTNIYNLTLKEYGDVIRKLKTSTEISTNYSTAYVGKYKFATNISEYTTVNNYIYCDANIDTKIITATLIENYIDNI